MHDDDMTINAIRAFAAIEPFDLGVALDRLVDPSSTLPLVKRMEMGRPVADAWASLRHWLEEHDGQRY